jgi:hypothetical protein
MEKPNTSPFDEWLNDLEEIPTDPTCSIDNPDCDSCGS